MSCREDLIKIAQEALDKLGEKNSSDAKYLFLLQYEPMSFHHFDVIDLKDISEEAKEEEKKRLPIEIMLGLCYSILTRKGKDYNASIELEELCQAYTVRENEYLRSKLAAGGGQANAAGGGQAIAAGGRQAIAAGGHQAIAAGRAEYNGGKKTKRRRNKKTKHRRNRKTTRRRQTRK